MDRVLIDNVATRSVMRRVLAGRKLPALTRSGTRPLRELTDRKDGHLTN